MRFVAAAAARLLWFWLYRRVLPVHRRCVFEFVGVFSSMMVRLGAQLLLAATVLADDVDPNGLECPNCHEIHDGRSPGHNGRPPLPSNPDMVIEITTDVLSVDGGDCWRVWLLLAAS